MSSGVASELPQTEQSTEVCLHCLGNESIKKGFEKRVINVEIAIIYSIITIGLLYSFQVE